MRSDPNPLVVFAVTVRAALHVLDAAVARAREKNTEDLRELTSPRKAIPAGVGRMVVVLAGYAGALSHERNSP